jgi:hypothetical protein
MGSSQHQCYVLWGCHHISTLRSAPGLSLYMLAPLPCQSTQVFPAVEPPQSQTLLMHSRIPSVTNIYPFKKQFLSNYQINHYFRVKIQNCNFYSCKYYNIINKLLHETEVVLFP